MFANSSHLVFDTLKLLFALLNNYRCLFTVNILVNILVKYFLKGRNSRFMIILVYEEIVIFYHNRVPKVERKSLGASQESMVAWEHHS